MAKTTTKDETEQRYRRLFAEQERSGLSIRAFARERGIPAGTLSSWKHVLRRRDAARAEEGHRTDGCEPRVQFLPVTVTGPAALPSDDPGVYEVLLGRSCVLRLPREFEVARVAALIKAVRSC